MSRPRSSKPSYCTDKSTNRAYVCIDGKRHYLGKPGTPDSRDAYDQKIGEWIARGRRPTPTPDGIDDHTLLVADLIQAFWNYATDFYTKPTFDAAGNPILDGDGKQARAQRGELDNYRLAIRPLRRLYGMTPLADFGPLALECVQQEMIRLGWARKHINRQLNRVRRVFYWGAAKEMISGSIVAAMSKVSPLRKNHPGTRETPRVAPVSEEHFRAVLPHLASHPRAMAIVQYYTGARSAELCALRTCDIDTTVTPWLYVLSEHKNAHHDLPRVIQFGPEARKVLAPMLRTDLQAFVFSPAESERLRHEELRASRQTRVQPSQVSRAEGAAERAPYRRRPPAERYTPSSYRRAIERGCEAAFDMPTDLKRKASDKPDQAKARSFARKVWHKKHRWHPHRIRHTAGTIVRRFKDLDASRAVLGHTTNRTTEIYAERDMRIVADVMERIG